MAPQVDNDDLFAQMYVRDPHTGYRLRPGEYGDLIVINSQGLRDPERPVAKPAGVRRVLVLGDSFAFGYVPDPQGFVRVLETLLGPGCEAINAGVPAWSIKEQAIWLRREGLAYDPDAVVVALFVSNGNALRAIDEAFEPAAMKRSAFRNLRKRSHLYRLAKRLLADIGGDTAERRRFEKLEWGRLEPFLKAGEPPFWAELRRATAERLREIRDLVAPRPVVVLVIPDEIQVNDELLRTVCRRFELDPAAYDLDRTQDHLRQVCAELGLEVVDPLPELRRRTAGGERLYLELDTHWNAAGNRLAAEALAASATLRRVAAPAR